MLMALFVAIEFLLSGGVAVMAQNSERATSAVEVSSENETVLSGENHKIHISASNNIQKEIYLKIYIKNTDGTAATDVTILNITEPDVVQLEQTDTEGNVTQRYLQAVLPAGGTVSFDTLLSVEESGDQDRQVMIEAQLWAEEEEQAATEGQDSVVISWEPEKKEETKTGETAQDTAQNGENLQTPQEPQDTEGSGQIPSDGAQTENVQAADMMLSTKAGDSLSPGDYVYLDTSGFTSWEDAGAVSALRYEPASGSTWLSVPMEEWETHLYRVKLPDDMKAGGSFQFLRVNPTDGTIWNYNPNNSSTNLAAALAAGSNTYRVTSYTAGTWASNTWNISSYAGETVYFMNMDAEAAMGILTAEFTVSGDSGIAGNTLEMTPVSGVTGLYQVTIPEGADYDTVTFWDNGTELAVETLIKGDYAPGDTNTFYYRVTRMADGSCRNGWKAYPSASADMNGRTLYLDKLSFSTSAEATIQIGTGAPVSLTADSNDAKTYSYTIPGGSGATQQTIITVCANGAEYHFMWTDAASNLLILENDMATVSGTYSRSYTVYFDAAVSKLSYAGSATDASIPLGANRIYYHAWDASGSEDGALTLTASHSSGSNQWKDVYKAELGKEYENILFYSSSGQGTYPTAKAAQTIDLTIPWDSKENPCFYPDTSDDAIYNNVNRSGYWDEVYTIRDAEAGKNAEGRDKDVVDIASGTFTRQEDTYYIKSTFFDYYTDYEINGNNRDDYSTNNAVNQRNWVTFRQFNQALSDYYRKANVSIPIYVGHFQPSSMGTPFSGVAGTLGLFGWENYNAFISTNNSNYDINGGNNKYNAAAQGLVSDTLKDGDLMAKGGTVPEPHFDRDFLKGNNSKNSVLGEVYENVSFPFTKKEMTIDGKTATYWNFDSSETTLQMKEDSTLGYYLEDVGNQNWSKNVNSSSAASGVSNTYGFFPFNHTAQATTASTYNYGFGTKLEFKFRLTEDGTVLAENDGTTVPIVFHFSGDDDVWVYIDGKLALDVGGAHGEVSGTLDFSTLTATVSAVKASAGSSGKTSSAFELQGEKTDEHTLTMYYMERGMWESNMAVSFNFPDENQLQVEKVVDKTEVNELFWDCFDNQSMFTYNIRTLATHYGTKELETSYLLPETYNDTFSSGTIGTTYATTLFQHVSSMSGQTDVVHWKAAQDDRTSAYRDRRYGVIYPESGNTVDISQMEYLEFKYYYDYTDTPTLGNMYLQLADSNGRTLGSATEYLSAKTYGTVTMANKKWVTVRVDLSKLTKAAGFDETSVKEIRFGYNYSRDFYLDGFVFYPESISSALTGFVVKQYEIPDYGSATSGELEIPVGAMYTSSITNEDGSLRSNVIREDGTFILENQETVTFFDQFRRGSYIELTEQTDPKLFDTSWTMYENGEPVTVMNEGKGDVVTNGSITDLTDVPSTIVDDGRTEVYRTGTTDGEMIQNAYDGVRPDNTFVFRSYAEPDVETNTTKLKVVYNNKVKTGSLTIRKTALCERDKTNLTGTYTFQVTFSNVGGYDLEPEPMEPIEVTLKVGEEWTMEGIPIGTHYTIEEILPGDGSELNGIYVWVGSSPGEENTRDDMVLIEGNSVQGSILSDKNNTTVKFQNTIRPVVQVSLEKLWKDMDGNSLTNGTLSSIFVQLQRRTAGSSEEYTVVPGYEKVTITPGTDGSWRYTIPDLDQYEDYKDENNPNEWEYRLVETDSGGNVVEQDTFWKNFLVTYREPETDPDTGNTSCTITNTLYDKTNVKIIKYGIGTDAKNPLQGAVFRLEKLMEDGTSDSSFTALEGTTGADGIVIFENVPDGTYLLTEIKAVEGYSLLKEPVTIVLDRENGCTVNDKTYTVDQETNTITLEISNRLKFVLPSTGGFGIFFIIISGIGIAAAGISIYQGTHQKGGKRSRR